MLKSEIIGELPNLSLPEREEVLASLLSLNASNPPTRKEKAILNEAEAEYRLDGDVGADWSDVEQRLRSRNLR